MSIKSDKWIKKMSLEEDMISPFSENQIRVDNEGNKLISYGVSSLVTMLDVQMNLKSLPISTPQSLIQKILMQIVLWTFNLTYV